jgi:spermidine/putrescine transport system substrate-binding protein
MKLLWFFLWFSQICWANNQELIILNWPDYLSKEIVANFEKEHQVKIKIFYFDSSSERNKRLFLNKSQSFDLINVSEHYLSPYIQMNWAMPLDRSLLPNLKHIEPRYLIKHPSNQLFAIPYFWGTLGIAYRQDLVSYPLTSWKQILSPSEELKNKISVIKEGFDLTAIALKSLGFPINEISPEALFQAQHLLLKQKSAVKRYAVWYDTPLNGLLTGSELAGIYYSGDALSMQKKNPNIAYILPKEGCFLWIDYWVVSPSSQNKLLAHKFLNYIMKPENAAQNSLEFNYATPNQTALQLLPKEHLENSIIFPPENIKRKCEFLQLPQDVNAIKSYNHLLIKLLQQ